MVVKSTGAARALERAADEDARRETAGSAGASATGTVTSKKGARVRAGPELTSDIRGELKCGTRLALGRRVALPEGSLRVEVTAPMAGYVSQRCITEESPRSVDAGATRTGAKDVGRLWCISDVHSDHKENMAWMTRTFSRPEFLSDALILAGDVAAKFDVIRSTLELCARCGVP